MKDIKQYEDVSEEKMAQIIFTEHMFLFHLGLKNKSVLRVIDNTIDCMIKAGCTTPSLCSHPDLTSDITDGAAEYWEKVRVLVKQIKC